MRVCITGGTGFIGTNLVKKLTNDGHNVHVLTRNHTQSHSDSITYHTISKEFSWFEQTIKNINPDFVIHCATYFVAEHKSEDLLELISANIEFGTNLLEALSKLDKNVPFINTGTAWQHYNNAPYEPQCLYAATKQAFEDIVTYYTSCKNIRALHLKLFDTYGPGDTRKKIIPLFKTLSKRVSKGENVNEIEFSPGEQILNLLHVNDVVTGFSQAIDYFTVDPEFKNCSYYLSATQMYSLKDVAKIFENILSIKLPIDWDKKPYRQRETFTPYPNIKILPSWKQKICLEEGIKEYLNL